VAVETVRDNTIATKRLFKTKFYLLRISRVAAQIRWVMQLRTIN